MDHDASRRQFLHTMGFGAAALAWGGAAHGDEPVIPGFERVPATPSSDRRWEPISDRRIRVGIVGYGLCKFGAAFSFQDHPNVEVVAVSDLFPDRCAGLAKACRCEKTYPSLEEMVKDDNIEAIFLATDAPSHAQQSIDVLRHGKHVAVAVPAVWGSLEDADRLFEAVKTSGLTYMMYETSSFRADCYAMRQVYRAGGFGELVYSEGEYYHYFTRQLPSFRDWRVGSIPMWYPTHATAYYVGVTDQPFDSVQCVGLRSELPSLQPGANVYDNPFADQVAMFETAEGGVARMLRSRSVIDKYDETGRVFGRRGWMVGTAYRGAMAELPDTRRPPLPPGVQPGGHGGSHGPLTHEFITALLENRKPMIDIAQSLNMTVCGIVAHQSALRDGERLKVPQYHL